MGLGGKSPGPQGHTLKGSYLDLVSSGLFLSTTSQELDGPLLHILTLVSSNRSKAARTIDHGQQTMAGNLEIKKPSFHMT